MGKCIKCGKKLENPLLLTCPECLEKIQDKPDCVGALDMHQIDTSKIITNERDVTNHPMRYNGGSEYECYKVLKNWLTPEQYKGFLLGNALKYQCRLGKKDDEVQEINKAEWYLNELKNCYGDK